MQCPFQASPQTCIPPPPTHTHQHHIHAGHCHNKPHDKNTTGGGGAHGSRARFPHTRRRRDNLGEKGPRPALIPSQAPECGKGMVKKAKQLARCPLGGPLRTSAQGFTNVPLRSSPQGQDGHLLEGWGREGYPQGNAPPPKLSKEHCSLWHRRAAIESPPGACESGRPRQQQGLPWRLHQRCTSQSE